MTVLTDPAECGPVTLALCQDAQTEAYDLPASLFDRKRLDARRARPTARGRATSPTIMRAPSRR